jgi:hypothetical protein
LDWRIKLSISRKRILFATTLVSAAIIVSSFAWYLLTQRIAVTPPPNEEKKAELSIHSTERLLSSKTDRTSPMVMQPKPNKEEISVPHGTVRGHNNTVNYASLVTGLTEQLAGQDKESKVMLIDFLSTRGSDESIEALKSIIQLDTDPDIRANAISAIRWDDDPETLMQLLHTESDPRMITSVLVAADLAQFDDRIRDHFDQIILDTLTLQEDSQVMNSILSYFGDKDPNWLVQAYTLLLARSDLPENVLDYMKIISEQESYLKTLFPTLN